jgi:ABC-type transport system involved in multi-copper enzyme maturation permease subunit
MIWLTFRQFRAQAVTALAALVVLAGYLIVLRNRMAAADATFLRDFREAYETEVVLIGALLLVLPALIGVFWGAPLVTRELEERTDRLVWNQSITRTRWLAVKLAVLTLVSVAVTGLLSLLLTWSASRWDALIGERFGALNFAARNITPIGYAAFAFLLGTVLGLLVRRTLPAMALTLALFAVVQVLLPTVVRQNLMTPVTATVRLDGEAIARADFMGFSDRGARIDGYTMPGAWSLTSSSQVFNADGSAYTSEQADRCRQAEPRKVMACTAEQDLHFSYTYQPAGRYWTFQWIELAVFLVLSLLLAGIGFRRIRLLG